MCACSAAFPRNGHDSRQILEALITQPHILEDFERDLRRKEHFSLEEKFALLQGMYELAAKLGHFRRERALEGIEDDIQLALRLNSIVSKSTD